MQESVTRTGAVTGYRVIVPGRWLLPPAAPDGPLASSATRLFDAICTTLRRDT